MEIMATRTSTNPRAEPIGDLTSCHNAATKRRDFTRETDTDAPTDLNDDLEVLTSLIGCEDFNDYESASSGGGTSSVHELSVNTDPYM